MNTTINQRYSTLATLRRLIPQRTLYYGEAVRLTELQANRLRQELGITSVELPVDAIERISRVQIIEIDHLPSSGVSQWNSGTWIIAIDADEPWQRQRFTTAHELWHVVNFPTERYLCSPGPFRNTAEKRELLADYFAGCLLMPKAHIKRLVGEGLSPADLADTFGVSERAINFRLVQLGMSDPRARCVSLKKSDLLLKDWRYACPPPNKEVAA